MEPRKIRLIMHLRKSGISDTAVLGALERVPREAFLPATFRDQAYEDIALPIGRGQTISRPLEVARMTQALAIGPGHRVLEIGTGSGYQAAVLARLARQVYSIELHRELLEAARARLKAVKALNVTTMVADGARGWPRHAPFERILVTCAGAQDPPGALLDQLAPGGVMLMPLGPSPREQAVTRIRRDADDGSLQGEVLWPTRFVPLMSPETAAESGTDSAAAAGEGRSA